MALTNTQNRHERRKPSDASINIERKIDAMLEQLEDMNRAFPDGPEAHRLAHEQMIKAAKAQEDFWNALKIDIAQKGVWGLLITVIGLVIVGLSAKFGFTKLI